MIVRGSTSREFGELLALASAERAAVVVFPVDLFSPSRLRQLVHWREMFSPGQWYHVEAWGANRDEEVSWGLNFPGRWTTSGRFK